MEAIYAGRQLPLRSDNEKRAYLTQARICPTHKLTPLVPREAEPRERLHNGCIKGQEHAVRVDPVNLG